MRHRHDALTAAAYLPIDGSAVPSGPTRSRPHHDSHECGRRTRESAVTWFPLLRRPGWVDNDCWAESASRTLDCAFNDAACDAVTRAANVEDEAANVEDEAANVEDEAATLEQRAKNRVNVWNPETKFTQARKARRHV
ncbi:hypothetical protein DL764_000930 [Monosporascus ibericus]|uniref:Glycosyl hydrolase family 92 domain-containing protein n=1 Tax=Monosporascus ibericus TaxID=155417 RepID=A0A4Q4TRN6_9PEZI|nr:hypothetical protein DL764_000930 [Monosporascus ibericus]